jgi:hypothetical protein
LCLKQPILSLARLADIRQAVLRGLARLADIRLAVLRGLARLANIRRAVLRGLARLANTRQAVLRGLARLARPRNTARRVFEKNVTRLDKFARVIRHFGEFGASGHCLIILQFCT